MLNKLIDSREKREKDLGEREKKRVTKEIEEKAVQKLRLYIPLEKYCSLNLTNVKMFTPN